MNFKTSLVNRLFPLSNTHYQSWSWATILASILICVMVSWLHFRHTQLLNQTTEVITNIHLARIELAKGFLYVTLSGDPNSPFGREDGLVLLQQAADTLEGLAANLDGFSTVENQAMFRQDLDTFQESLADFRTAAASTPAQEAALRIAFHDLERQASEMDAQSHDQLVGLKKSFNKQYGIVLGMAAILLAGISTVLILVEQARKKTDEALAESENRYSTLFRKSNIPVVLMKLPEMVIADINEAVEVLTGYNREELLGSNFAEHGIINHTQRAEAISQFEADGVLASKEMRIVTKEGDERIIIFNTNLVEINRKPFAFTSMQDITDRKNAEKKLRESEEIFRAFIDQSHDGIILSDAQGKIIEWNHAITQISGLNRNAVLGKGVWDIQFQMMTLENRSQRTVEQLRAAIQDILEEGHNPAFDVPSESEIRTQQGERKIIAQTSFPIYSQTGCRLGAIIRDITERKQAEKALERTRNTLAQAQKIAHMGSFEYISATKTTVWSEEEYSLYGLDPVGTSPGYEEMLQKLIHPDDAALLNEVFTKAMRDGSIYELEHRIVRPDGSVRWVYDRAHPYFNEQGELERYIGTTLDITERKQAEQKLRESEENYQNLFEVNPHPMWVYDLETLAFMAVNETAITKYGYSREEFLQMTILDIRPPEDHQRLLENVATVTEGLNEAGNWRHLKKDGSVIDVEITAHTMEFYGRKAEIVLAHDITDRKRVENERREAQDSLQRERQLLRMLIDNMPDYIFMKDTQSRFLVANQATAELMGVDSPEALLGKTDFDFYPKDLATSYFEHEQRIIQTEENVRNEENLQLDMDQKEQWLSTTKLAVHDPHGQVIGLIGIERNITERKQAEQKLRESEQKYRTLVNAMADGVFVAQEERFVYTNTALPELLGYTVEEFERMTFEQVISPEYLAMWTERYRKRIAGEKPEAIYQVQLMNKTQTEKIWVELRANPIFYNEKPAVLGIIRDITERKRAEEKLRANEQKLRSLVETETHFVIRVDVEGRYTYWNEKYQSEFGWLHPQTNLADASPFDSICEHHHQRAREAAEQCIAHPGEVVRVELDKPARDGSIRSTLWEWVCLTDENGQPSEIQAMGIEFTERKQAEQNLRASEEKFRLLAETIGEVFWIFDNQQGTMTYISPAYEKIWGRTIESLYKDSRQYIEAILPEDRTIMFAALERQARGAPTQMEYRIVRPDGLIRWISDRSFPVFDEKGVVVRTTGIATDITERKKSEELQRESDARFAIIVENSPVAIGISRASDGKLIQINSAFSRLYGFTAEETLGYTTLELGIWAIPADRQRFVEMLTTERYVREMETTARVKSGEERSVILWGELIEISGETCMMVQIVDITDRKHAEVLLNQRLDDLALINKLNTAVNQGEDIAGITELLANETKEIFGGLGAGTFLVDPNTRTIVFQPLTLSHDWIGNLEKLIGRSLPQIAIPIGGNDHFNQVLNSNRGLLITDPESINQWLADFINTGYLSEDIQPLIRKLIPAASKRLNIQSVIVIPLIAGEKVLGLIEFVSENQFDDSVLERLQNVRHQLAEVIIRKQAEQSLRESEEKYRLLSEELEQRVQQRTAEVKDLYNNAPAGYHSLDIHGNFIEINQTQLNWSGYSRDEMLGHSFRELLTPKSQEMFDREFPIFKERGSVRDMEFEMLRKDGSIFPVLVNAIAIYDANGDYVMSRSTVFDNTERKQAEQAIRESEETYRSLFESASDAIFLIDIATRTYIRVNSRAPELLGVSSTEVLIGRNALDFIDPSEMDQANDLMQALLSGERIPPYERTFRRADRSPVKTEINLSLIRDSKGQPKLLQSVVRDITLRKQAEEVLRESETQLRISRDKLSAANAALERASRLKDEFLSSMSHELRTPLTGILGLSEALQFNTYGPLTEKQNKALRTIEESGRHLLDLINDILDLSKIEAGMLDLNIDLVSLADVCQSSLQLTKGMAHKKNQSVRFSMEPPSLQIRGDARRLKQMLVNLLSNAIKFTPENGSLGLEVKGDEKEKVVRLTVWDKGIGIAPENLERLFQPFVQLESSLSRQYEGSGLGLSLVQRMAELQGGSVHIESELGAGSRFTILLPWMPDLMQPSSPTKEVTSSIKKALIVEDREIDAGQLTRYLHILGIDSIMQNMGHGVTEIAERKKPDVILLDLHLPDQSGFDVLANLKSNPNTRNIPVIFCSVEERRSQAISLGAAGYLIKPLSFPELRDEVDKVASILKKRPTATLITVPIQPTVLIVDDNKVVIETISDFLEAQNFRVAAVRSGIELLEIVADLRPDLILMDIQMPVMDGLEATRRVRAHPDQHVSQVPIIAVTALAMPGDRERCLAAGANEYMSKPIGLRQLVTTIHELLKNY